MSCRDSYCGSTRQGGVAGIGGFAADNRRLILPVNAFEEGANLLADFRSVALEGEVPCVKKDNFGSGIVSTEGFCTGWQKERIVPAPNSESRRSMRAEILLKLRIERNVGLIIAEEIELNLRALWSVQKEHVQCDGLWRNSQIGIFDTGRILPTRCLRRAEGLQGVAILLCRILPVGTDGDQPSLNPSEYAFPFCEMIAAIRSGCLRARRKPTGAP